MKNNVLIIPRSISDTKESHYNFLFPLKGFCVGQIFEVTLEEVPMNSFVYMNRIFDKKGIEELESALLDNQDKIRGIVFEDLGVLEIAKKFSKKIELLYFASHGMCSYHTLNAMSEFWDSVFISPDVTKSEIDEILAHSTGVSMYLYGPLPYLYSRRTLLTNFSKNQKREMESISHVHEKITDKHFTFVENEFGTVCYDSANFDGRELLECESVTYFLINLEYTDYDVLDSWLQDFFDLRKLANTTTGFLHQKTIYRLPPKEGLR